MKKYPQIFIEEYSREDAPGRSRRLRKYVEKLYDIDLQGTDLDGVFMENLMEEEKNPEDDSDAWPGCIIYAINDI